MSTFDFDGDGYIDAVDTDGDGFADDASVISTNDATSVL